jgi:hypothetical protein
VQIKTIHRNLTLDKKVVIFTTLKATQPHAFAFEVSTTTRIQPNMKIKSTALATFSGILFLALSLLNASNSNAQGPVTLCLGQDATVCPGQAVIINNCNSGTTPGTAAGLYLNAPTNVQLSDDAWSGTVNIGFPFSFYGNTYSQCVIGSNGLVSFNLANAGGYCPWALNGVGTLPNAGFAAAKNTIMLT